MVDIIRFSVKHGNEWCKSTTMEFMEYGRPLFGSIDEAEDYPVNVAEDIVSNVPGAILVIASDVRGAQ
jgi:hypothetical protein